jgi:hypothetical protein
MEQPEAVRAVGGRCTSSVEDTVTVPGPERKLLFDAICRKNDLAPWRGLSDLSDTVQYHGSHSYRGNQHELEPFDQQPETPLRVRVGAQYEHTVLVVVRRLLVHSFRARTGRAAPVNLSQENRSCN